jgi:hypothetical protein
MCKKILNGFVRKFCKTKYFSIFVEQTGQQFFCLASGTSSNPTDTYTTLPNNCMVNGCMHLQAIIELVNSWIHLQLMQVKAAHN